MGANEIHTKLITHTHSYQLELSEQRQWEPLREKLNQSLTLTHINSNYLNNGNGSH